MSQLNGAVRIHNPKPFTRDPHSNQLPLLPGNNFHDDPLSRVTQRKTQLLTTNGGPALFAQTPDVRRSDGSVAAASQSQRLGGSTGPYSPYDADAFVCPTSAAYTCADPVPPSNIALTRSLPPTYNPNSPYAAAGGAGGAGEGGEEGLDGDATLGRHDTTAAGSPSSRPAAEAPPNTANVVLRFAGYAKEAVAHSGMERERGRKYLFAYHVTDGTVVAKELVSDNSGMDAQPFIGRSRLCIDDGGVGRMSAGYLEGKAIGDVASPGGGGGLSGSVSMSGSFGGRGGGGAGAGAGGGYGGAAGNGGGGVELPRGGAVVTPEHLLPGSLLPVRGRVIRFVECDEATRKYLTEVVGMDVPANYSWPSAEEIDAPSVFRKERMLDSRSAAAATLPPAARAEKEWRRGIAGGQPRKPAAEAALGVARLRDTQGDVDVRLAFAGVCDERAGAVSGAGVGKGYVARILLYIHVGDCCVEMYEWFVEPNGATNRRRVLARQRVLKSGEFGGVGVPGGGESVSLEAALQPGDLDVGKRVVVHGRSLDIVDASEATRNWYRRVLGVELAPKVSTDHLFPQPTEALFEPPPHSGFGCAEDSIQSWRFLIPKPPKVDGARRVDHGTTRLVWSMALAPPSEQLMGPESGVVRPADVDRRFRLTYHVADDTAQVDELPQRGGGFVPGRFLQRMKVQKQTPVPGFPAEYTMSPLRAEDLVPSARITLYNRTFVLVEPDTRTALFMQNIRSPDTHRPPPGAAPPPLGSESRAMTPAEAALLTRLREVLATRFAQAGAAFRVCCGFGGSLSSGVVTPASLHAFMRSGLGVDAAPVDAQNIVKVFDADEDGVLNLSEFARLLDPAVSAAGGGLVGPAAAAAMNGGATRPASGGASGGTMGGTGTPNCGVTLLPRITAPDLRPVEEKRVLQQLYSKVMARRFEVGRVFQELLSCDPGHPPGRLTPVGLVQGARQRVGIDVTEVGEVALRGAFFADLAADGAEGSADGHAGAAGRAAAAAAGAATEEKESVVGITLQTFAERLDQLAGALPSKRVHYVAAKQASVIHRGGRGGLVDVACVVSFS